MNATTLVPHPLLHNAESHTTIAGLQASLPESVRHSLCSGAELSRRQRRRVPEGLVPTMVPVLDQLLGGGIRRGTVVEMVGRGSCGRFATLLATLKAVTDSGEVATLIDLGNQLDPQAAASLGIDLERLLWLRPQRLPDAVAAAEMLAKTEFPVIGMDLGLPPVRGRTPLAAWLRLARTCAAEGTAVLVSSPYRLSGCAAATVVTAQHGRGTWAGTIGTPRLLDGLAVKLAISKRRGQSPGEKMRASFLLPEATAIPVTQKPTQEVRYAQAV